MFCILSVDFREDFSFTPYTTYFYMKLGRKAPLVKSPTHTLSMKMRTTEIGAAVVKAVSGQGKAKEGKRSIQSGGDAPASKKVKTRLP